MKPDCTAVEWYAGNKKGGKDRKDGYCLLTITEWGAPGQATRGYGGERWMDAKCYVRTKECDGNELEDGLFVAIDQFLEKTGRAQSSKNKE